MTLPKLDIKILKRKSLLAMVKNAAKGGNNYFFRNLYAKKNDKKIVDILENGRNSCGVLVSWILIALELIKYPHASVDGTEKDMIKSGWREIKKLKPGAVIFWEEKKNDRLMFGKYEIYHRHCGFYIGNGKAISNDSKKTGFPIKHHFTYNGTRKIEKIYWHSELEDK